eukprot:426568-Prorocentrum_minimum.AAC.1
MRQQGVGAVDLMGALALPCQLSFEALCLQPQAVRLAHTPLQRVHERRPCHAVPHLPPTRLCGARNRLLRIRTSGG